MGAEKAPSAPVLGVVVVAALVLVVPRVGGPCSVAPARGVTSGGGGGLVVIVGAE